jgi:hypothetical protein
VIKNRNVFRALTSILLLGLLAALVAGCGSGSGSSSASVSTTARPTGPLTKAAFVKVGNEICSDAAKERGQDLKKAAAESDGEGGNSEMTAFVEIALESVEATVGELSALKPPTAQKKEAAALVASLEGEMKKLEATPADAVDPTAFKASNVAARRAGLSDCAI